VRAAPCARTRCDGPKRERERESDVRNLTATFNDGGATQLGPAVSLKSSNRPRSMLR
jgi:hypothetical protein